MGIDRATGPACPDCGCEDSRIIDVTWRGDRHECGFCARRFIAPRDVPEEASEDAGVVYAVLRCPRCRSDRTRVTSTRRPLRYHKCGSCGKNFKSIEQ